LRLRRRHAAVVTEVQELTPSGQDEGYEEEAAAAARYNKYS